MIKFGNKVTGIERSLPSLVETLSRRNIVRTVYLFGSRATNSADELSDIDIALHVNGSGVPLDVELELLADITSTLKTDEVSLVILNNASLVIAYGVIKAAKVLYSRDERERLDYEALVMRRYFDFKFYLDTYDRDFVSFIQSLK